MRHPSSPLSGAGAGAGANAGAGAGAGAGSSADADDDADAAWRGLARALHTAAAAVPGPVRLRLLPLWI